MASSLEQSITELAKKYGTNVVRRASEIEEVRKIPTGIPMVDYVTTGGIPINRITEFYGDFSSLKSYSAYKAIAKFQKYDFANNVEDAVESMTYKIKKSTSKDESIQDLTFAVVDKVKYRKYPAEFEPRIRKCVLIDIEGTYEREWGKTIGIDNDGLILIVPPSLNQAVDIIDAFLSDEEVGLVVIDSMGAMGADAEIESSMENEQMSVNARFWNKATRKFTSAINRNPSKDVTLLVINSAYEKVGMVFGDPEKVKNGKNMMLAKSMSVRFSPLKEIRTKIEGKDVIAGRNITVRNKKNKTGQPYLDGSFYFSYINDGGLKAGETDVVTQLIDLGIDYGLIERSGASYQYGELKVRGAEALRNKIAETPELSNKLRKEVYKKINGAS